MASPESVEANERGVFPPGDARAGWPQPWRFVRSRFRRAIGEIVDDPNRGPWRRTQPDGKTQDGHTDMAEQVVTIGEQIAWTHEFSDGIVRDSGDVLIEIMEFAIEWRRANGVATTAKGKPVQK